MKITKKRALIGFSLSIFGLLTFIGYRYSIQFFNNASEVVSSKNFALTTPDDRSELYLEESDRATFYSTKKISSASVTFAIVAANLIIAKFVPQIGLYEGALEIGLSIAGVEIGKEYHCCISGSGRCNPLAPDKDPVLCDEENRGFYRY